MTWRLKGREPGGPAQCALECLDREASRLGVLLADVVTAEEQRQAGQLEGRVVSEPRAGAWERRSTPPEVIQEGVPGDRPEREDHARTEQRELAVEPAPHRWTSSGDGRLPGGAQRAASVT